LIRLYEMNEVITSNAIRKMKKRLENRIF